MYIKYYDELWKKHCFTITFYGSIIVLFLIYFFYNGEVGTFTTNFNFLRKKRTSCKKKHENECRHILESIYYPYKFPSIRPEFLKNPVTGRNLEIDCYNDYLKIGLEYQGRQHREFCPYFHKTHEEFEYQLEKDKYKKQVCEKMGIKMIYIPDTIKYENLEYYIKTQL